VKKIREKIAGRLLVRRLRTTAGGFCDANMISVVSDDQSGGPNDSNFNANTCV
jgi:hypothetical protein